MKRRLVFLLWMLGLFLAACAPTGDTPSAPAAAGTPTLAPTAISPTASAEASCRALNFEPTPGPDEPSLFPRVSADDHSWGAEDPKVTLVIYGDYQGQGEAAMQPILERLLDTFPDDLQVVWRSYPQVKLHDKAVLAAQAAEAADLQQHFGDFHKMLLQKQSEWKDMPLEDFQPWLVEQAGFLGLDTERFVADLQGPVVKERIADILGYAMEVQLPGTPLMLFNGQLYQGMYDYLSLDNSVRLVLLGERQFHTCPPWVIDPSKEYLATLHTEHGDVVIQLYPDKAPYTVNNFVYLARQGWYDHITFHRVIEGFMAQTGDPSGTGLGGPGYFIINEIAPDLKFDRAGVVGMANAGPNTNGSQFFITYAPAEHLDGKYTIFGQVVSGMDVLAQLTPRAPQPGKWLPPGDALLSVTIEER